MKIKKITLPFLLLILLSTIQVEAQQRKLTAYLFPYLPQQESYYDKLEAKFEKLNPNIDLEIILDEEEYYYGGLLSAEADVYEIDCIFLDDMVKKQRIDPFPNQNYLVGKDTLNFDGVHSNGGTLYGIPHWVCSYFMIYNKKDIALRDATYLKEIEGVLGKNRGALMMGVGGNLSTGQTYIDGLCDDKSNKSEVATALADSKLDSTMINNMKRLMVLVAKDGEIVDDHIDRFISGDARAYVTYAETMNGIMQAITPNSHIKREDVMIRDWPLSDNGTRPLGWVDALAIKKGLNEIKKADALTFIDFMMSDAAYYLALIPESGEVPRYLLPPYKKYYLQDTITTKAPLYKVMFNLVEDFSPLKLPQVTNDEMLKLGERVLTEIKVE